MIIRKAREEDLDTILDLGKRFGHLMLYQTSPSVMKLCLPRILVAEEMGEVVGYYHYIVSGDKGFSEMLEHYKLLPQVLIEEASNKSLGSLCVLMQGGSHREVFTKFVQMLQISYPEIWCFCSIRSQRPETYEKLGFSFKEKFTFFNVNKGEDSTYRLGRWTK